jgi:hypothetical protein
MSVSMGKRESWKRVVTQEGGGGAAGLGAKGKHSEAAVFIIVVVDL